MSRVPMVEEEEERPGVTDKSLLSSRDHQKREEEEEPVAPRPSPSDAASDEHVHASSALLTTTTTPTVVDSVAAGDDDENNDENEDHKQERDDDDDDDYDYYYHHGAGGGGPSSMTFALFVYWILPVVLIALYRRYNVDTDLPTLTRRPLREDDERSPVIGVDDDDSIIISKTGHESAAQKAKKKKKKKVEEEEEEEVVPKTEYEKIVMEIMKRRKRWNEHSAQQNIVPGRGRGGNDKKKKKMMKTTSSSAGAGAASSGEVTGSSSDPNQVALQDKIDNIQRQVDENPTDMYKAIQLADLMRYYDVTYAQGGKYQQRSIDMYLKVIPMALEKKREMQERNKPTDVPAAAAAGGGGGGGVAEEITLDYPDKSIDGLLCAVYTSLGKMYFMANMFERSVESYDRCIEDIEPDYLDAKLARGNSLLILGRYDGAGSDFWDVIQSDRHRLFTDSFVGLAKVLNANENAIPGGVGWDRVVPLLDHLVLQYESQFDSNPKMKKVMETSLHRFHQTLFAYHDTKSGDYEQAWDHLTKACRYKMATLSPWTSGLESRRVLQAKTIFKTSFFWTSSMGSDTVSPIFIVGFPRSGSTLLERVLDAHPDIVGTGENSVFNGRLDEIRNKIVKASLSGSPDDVYRVNRELADDVVDEMKRRWQILKENTGPSENEDDHSNNVTPARFVDKMLTNYHNIGMIHMLYPKALILHVAREPMDVLLSNFKHDFPAGSLEYTCDFEALAELYTAYRDVMEHWDTVLPGRVTHVRYEDMVKDFPGMAKAVVAATGLPWNDGVLQFHKKKHAVNTLSTTQVRKGVYKDSLSAWKRYEDDLQPLKELVRDYVRFNLKTTLPGYQPPVTTTTTTTTTTPATPPPPEVEDDTRDEL